MKKKANHWVPQSYLRSFSIDPTQPKEKRTIWRFSKLEQQILKQQARPQFLDNRDDFIPDPLLPRLLSLFGYEDLENTIACFSKILNVSPMSIKEALLLLKNLGLVQENPESETWSSPLGVFKVPDGKGKLNLRKFHEKSLLEALKAFDLPKDTRSYKSLLLPMTEIEYQQFLQLLDDFSNEQLHRYDSATYGEKCLYQANFNIYPVGSRVDSSANK